MAQQEGWTPDDVRNIILNPAHCLVEPPTISEGQWISANVRLIAELGPEKYLRALLDVLKGS